MIRDQPAAHPAHSPLVLLAARVFLCVALGIAVATSAGAVLPISGNGNTSAPTGGEDPGFAHLGKRSSGGLSLIYMGAGWVLTANHVGEADFKQGTTVYPHIPGSGVQFLNEDQSPADLLAFQIVGAPDLPDLPILEIAKTTPSEGTSVTMIGRGFNQDNAISWQQPSPPTLREGWTWGASGGTMRWGTNVVSDPTDFPASTTDNFVVDFTKPGDPGVTTHEAQAVIGDSGGAVFARNGEGEWELAGVMYETVVHAGQPALTALDGNLTYIVDLARFRTQLIPVVRPECSDEYDNDGDGRADYPDDWGCPTPEDLTEVNELPSLGHPALAVLATLLVVASLPAMKNRSSGRQPRHR